MARKCDGDQMNVVPQNRDALLTRDETAAALAAAGFPVKSKTLATKASRGGGPPYHLFGPRVLYRWEDALKWARTRLSPPRSSTSEANAPPASQRRRKVAALERAIP
jgi:hypothetical protein